MSETIYKILPAAAWEEAKRQGVYDGAPVDLADGFIHFSAAAQVRETAAKHFAGQAGLVLVGFDPASFTPDLKWEVSRGGALFPHLYAQLFPDVALSETSLPLGADGLHVFPADIP